jgi:hypothetical protein
MTEKFLRWGFLTNVWGWFHALAGGVLYHAIKRVTHLGDGWVLLSVFTLALGWEVGEWLHEKSLTPQFSSYPAGREQFFYDSVGDILLALAVACLSAL